MFAVTALFLLSTCTLAESRLQLFRIDAGTKPANRAGSAEPLQGLGFLTEENSRA
jgi:hypothetical protein